LVKESFESFTKTIYKVDILMANIKTPFKKQQNW